MTPDLMEAGAPRHDAGAQPARPRSGGRAAAISRPLVPGQVDVRTAASSTWKTCTVSFDGFKAINGLNLDIAPASCAASSAPTAPARRR